MDSLRSRPSQAPRKALQKAPSKLSKPTARPKATRVDDKIKKRMSMRYAEISSPLDAIPAMPTLMDAREPDEDRTIKADDAKVAAEDKKALSADDFDPDAFLKTKLANSTEAELRSLQSALHNAKNDTAAELQRSVFKNYAEFVLISKEISVLENEMLELKDLISDYKSMPSMLNIPDPTSLTSATLSTYKRSSVADLRVLYFNQMQTLHSTVEGAAKFVPVTPGRHVVGEFENVLGLNAATYRIMHKVKFVVLDDAVLVAKRRRRNAGGGGTTDGSGSTVNEGKLVAEKCWPLSEMVVLDTKDSPNMTNVFKVRHGKETHVYRTEAPHEKKQILALFRQVAEELQQKKRKEREGEHERRKSMWQQNSGGGRGSPAPPMPVPDWLSELAKKGGEIPGMADDAKSKAERDARFVSDWSDDLTVAIALKEWKKAVQLVEEGQAKSSTIPSLSAKLPTLTAQLTSSLLDALALPSNRKSNVVNIITLLNRLKAGAAARNTFLEMRTKVVQGLMRKIPFEGHAGAYIAELSVVFFTCIKHTADWYLAAFRENEVASSFIAWAKHQIETYCSIFRKQVYSSDADPKVISECIQITHIQSKKLLEEYGLDFKYLLNQLLVPNPNPTALGDAAPPSLKVNEQRQSKQIVMAVKAGQHPGLRTKASVTHLQPAPPPPTLSAPPVSRRRTPGPPGDAAGSSNSQSSSSSSLSSSTNLPPPIPGASSSSTPSYLGGRRTPVSARGAPPSSASLESPTPSRERSSSTLGDSTTTNPRSYLSGNRTPVSGRPPPSSPALGSRDLSSSTSSNPADVNRDRSDSRSTGGYYASGRSTPTAGDRDRPPRGVPRASPALPPPPVLGGAGQSLSRTQSPAPPPPRSVNRPPSSAGVSTPVRPPRQGMF